METDDSNESITAKINPTRLCWAEHEEHKE